MENQKEKILNNFYTFDYNKEIFNFDEAQFFLGISRSALFSLMEKEKIGQFKLGKLWKFSKKSILDWVDKQTKN